VREPGAARNANVLAKSRSGFRRRKTPNGCAKDRGRPYNREGDRVTLHQMQSGDIRNTLWISVLTKYYGDSLLASSWPKHYVIDDIQQMAPKLPVQIRPSEGARPWLCPIPASIRSASSSFLPPSQSMG
jgi:hypothetical protein